MEWGESWIVPLNWKINKKEIKQDFSSSNASRFIRSPTTYFHAQSSKRPARESGTSMGSPFRVQRTKEQFKNPYLSSTNEYVAGKPTSQRNYRHLYSHIIYMVNECDKRVRRTESGFDIFWFLAEFYIAGVSLNAILTRRIPSTKCCNVISHTVEKVFEHGSTPQTDFLIHK